MRALIQRVTKAAVSVGGEKISAVGPGMVVLLGIREGDGEKDCDFLAEKIANLRIMVDEKGKMNKSITETGGEILLVSQFTLYANTSAGRRPSFIQAAPPEAAEVLYERFVEKLKERQIPTKTGKFGEYMEVEIVNDGPVTIMIESEGK